VNGTAGAAKAKRAATLAEGWGDPRDLERRSDVTGAAEESEGKPEGTEDSVSCENL